MGIVRTEQALARYALARRPDIQLSVYDKTDATFRAINPRWAEHVVSWQGAVGRRRGRLRSLLPSRYTLIETLERWRVASGEGAIARGIAHAQRLLLLARRRRRRGVVPFKLAVGPPLALGPRDVILSVGCDWEHKDGESIAALKRRFGFRFVVMCYDIIPLQFPNYVTRDHVTTFRRYWTAIFPVADRVLVNSGQVMRDVAGYCADNGIALPDCRLVRLGYDRPAQTAKVPLPNELEAGRFILFVGTIDPHKGHRLLIRVWQRLLAAGIPQRERFKLAFVGRRGLDAQAVLEQINDRGAFAGTLLHLEGVADDQLTALYRAAAFSVFPSQYEGFGLPVIEAFANGKAVIASTGGALPETVGDLSPCLDPNDDDAWFQILQRWIEQPEAREPYEQKIRVGFPWPTWEEAAAQIFDAVRCRASG